MAKIGEARFDERGALACGQPGDQTGEEVKESPFYNSAVKPWQLVFRCKDAEKAKLFALYMKQACANNHVGYAQYTNVDNHFAGRYGFHYAMCSFKSILEINVDCNCDCSSLVSEIVNQAGIPVSVYMVTAEQVKIFDQTGMFDKITFKEGMKLKTGDVMWRNGHTAIITEGDPDEEGKCTIGTVTTDVNLRTGPVNLIVNFCRVDRNDGRGVRKVLYKGETAEIIGEQGNWYQLKIVGKDATWTPWATKSAIKASVVDCPKAKSGYDSSLEGRYVVKTALYLRQEAGVLTKYVTIMKKGAVVTCNGCYDTIGDIVWLKVRIGNYEGYCSSKYLVKE